MLLVSFPHLPDSHHSSPLWQHPTTGISSLSWPMNDGVGQKYQGVNAPTRNNLQAKTRVEISHFPILWDGNSEVQLIPSPRSPQQGLASFAQSSKLRIKVHYIGLISFPESFLSSLISVSWNYLPNHIFVPGCASWRNSSQDRLSTRAILGENTPLDLVLKLRSLSYSEWVSQA